jgi:hypothetical protein
VQPHRLGHFRPKALGEPVTADLLVMRVVGPVGKIVRHILDEVSDIVQQRGNDERRRRPGGLRKIRGLQGMFGHRHILAEVRVCAAPVEDGENIVGDGHEAFSGWNSCRSNAASLYTLSRVR